MPGTIHRDAMNICWGKNPNKIGLPTTSSLSFYAVIPKLYFPKKTLHYGWCKTSLWDKKEFILMTELQNLYLNFKEKTPMSFRKEHRGPSFLLSVVSGWELQEASGKRGMFCFLIRVLVKKLPEYVLFVKIQLSGLSFSKLLCFN